MKPPVLMDTGPLVAILNARDAAHEKCQNALSALDPPFLTTWPVITEAAYLLRSDQSLVLKLVRSINQGFMRLAWIDENDTEAIAKIIEAYADQNFQIADVSLMHLANREEITAVFTLDVKDFSVFRKSDGTSLTIIPE